MHIFTHRFTLLVHLRRGHFFTKNGVQKYFQRNKFRPKKEFIFDSNKKNFSSIGQKAPFVIIHKVILRSLILCQARKHKKKRFSLKKKKLCLISCQKCRMKSFCAVGSERKKFFFLGYSAGRDANVCWGEENSFEKLLSVKICDFS